jgi:hypothetical protein
MGEDAVFRTSANFFAWCVKEEFLSEPTFEEAPESPSVYHPYEHPSITLKIDPVSYLSMPVLDLGVCTHL